MHLINWIEHFLFQAILWLHSSIEAHLLPNPSAEVGTNNVFPDPTTSSCSAAILIAAEQQEPTNTIFYLKQSYLPK